MSHESPTDGYAHRRRSAPHDIYQNLYYAYNISINSYKEKKSQSNLDIAEKHGFLGKMFDIVSKMVKSINNGD